MAEIISFGGCFGEKLTSFGPFWCTGCYTGIGQNCDLPFGGLLVAYRFQPKGKNIFRSYTTSNWIATLPGRCRTRAGSGTLSTGTASPSFRSGRRQPPSLSGQSCSWHLQRWTVYNIWTLRVMNSHLQTCKSIKFVNFQIVVQLTSAFESAVQQQQTKSTNLRLLPVNGHEPQLLNLNWEQLIPYIISF